MTIPAIVKRISDQRRGVPGASSSAPPAWSDMTGSEQFARAFLTLRTAFGGQAAFSFWVTVSQGEGHE